MPPPRTRGAPSTAWPIHRRPAMRMATPRAEAGRTRRINVGLADADLRLCLAVEAARQGELRLAGQQANLQAGEARATSVLGWSATGLSAMAVLALDQQRRMLVVPSAILLALCVVMCVRALWPKMWHTAGYTGEDLAGWQVGSELELREALASGYESAASDNKARMDHFARCMVVAWVSLALAPLAGILMIMAFSGGRA